MIPVLLVTGILALTLRIHTMSYGQLLHLVLDRLQRPDLEPRLRTTYFSPAKFAWLRNTMTVLSVVAIVLWIVLWIYRHTYVRLFYQFTRAVWDVLKRFGHLFTVFSGRWGWIGIGLLVLTAMRSVYYAATFDLQYDEAWNANLFLRGPIWSSLVAYNNYPLHNILLGILVKLFGDGMPVLRAPSILFGLATMMSIMMLVYHLFRDKALAFSLGAVFACMPVSLFYMLYARGVMLELFFVTWITGVLLGSVQHQLTRRSIILLCILNAMATLSMLSHPVFICASGLALFLTAVNRNSVGSAFHTAFAYFAGSLLLSTLFLLPMMMGTGLLPVVEAAFGMQHISLLRLVRYIGDCSFFLTGFRYALWLCLLFSVVLIIVYRRSSQIAFQALLNICLLLSITTLLCNGALPPERSLSFFLLIPLSLAGMLVSFLRQKTKQSTTGVVVAALLVLILSGRAHTHPFLNWSRQLDHEVRKAATCLEQAGVETLYNDNRDFDYFIPGIDYYMHHNGKQIEFNTSASTSTRRLSTPGKETQAVVVSPERRPAYPGFTVVLYSYGDVLILGKTP